MKMYKLTIIYCDEEWKELRHEVLYCKGRETLQLYAKWAKDKDEHIQYRIEECEKC